MPLHWEQDAHFAAAVIANSLEGALLRVSLAIAAVNKFILANLIKKSIKIG